MIRLCYSSKMLFNSGTEGWPLNLLLYLFMGSATGVRVSTSLISMLMIAACEVQKLMLPQYVSTLSFIGYTNPFPWLQGTDKTETHQLAQRKHTPLGDQSLVPTPVASLTLSNPVFSMSASNL